MLMLFKKLLLLALFQLLLLNSFYKKEAKPETSFKPEIDVRGMIGDDAWFVVDKYIDDAILAAMPTVRIIHGKGTGALKAALWKYFKSDKRIQSFRHGEYGEGDAGVTVLTLG